MAIRNYYTQMEAARKNIITPEMKACAREENISEEELRAQIAKGTAVIPANPSHRGLVPHSSVSSMSSSSRRRSSRRLPRKCLLSMASNWSSKLVQ